MDILSDNKFTGWATYPVQVYGRKGELLPGYHGLAIRSWAGEVDLSHSQMIDKPPRVPGGKAWKAYRGICFDESKWDGSDIFRIDEGMRIVTILVRDAFKRARVTNVSLTPLSEVETDTIIYEVLGRKRPAHDD